MLTIGMKFLMTLTLLASLLAQIAGIVGPTSFNHYEKTNLAKLVPDDMSDGPIEEKIQEDFESEESAVFFTALSNQGPIIMSTIGFYFHLYLRQLKFTEEKYHPDILV